LELLGYIHRNPVRAGMVNRIDEYCWSSHAGYVSSNKEWRWLYKDFCLDMLEPDKERQRSAYRKFVAGEDDTEVLRFFQKKNLPAILGKDAFIDTIRRKFSQDKQHPEMPDAQILKPDITKIKNAVCRCYAIKPEDLMHTRRGVRNEARNVAVYLSRQYTGAKLETIGRAFAIAHYSTVSSAVATTARELRVNRGLKKRVDKILQTVNKSQ